MSSNFKNIFTYTISILFLLIFSLFILNKASAEPISYSNQIVGVRVTDYLNFKNNVSNLQKSYTYLLNNLKGKKTDKIFNIFTSKLPSKSYTRYNFEFTVISSEKDSKLMYFKTYIVTYENITQNFNMTLIKQVELIDTTFSIKVSLVDRKMILEDIENSIKMVLPLGVGSFDENILNDGVSIITPRFKNAYLDKSLAISIRKKPRYFAGKPFLRISTDEDSSKGRTNIGFHVQPNLASFIRGFDSHGCMRMQLADLELLHDILKNGPHQRLNLKVSYKLKDSSEHPFPKRDKRYKAIVNYGTKDFPMYKLDRDKLVQLTSKKKMAPLALLIDDPRDDYHDLFDYKMAWRNKNYPNKVKEYCASQTSLEKTEYVFDSSKFIFNESKYVVSREKFKPRFDGTESARERSKLLKKADRTYSKAVKKMSKEKSSALSRFNKQVTTEKKRIAGLNSSINKRNEEKMSSCTNKFKTKKSLKGSLYTWWVH